MWGLAILIVTYIAAVVVVFKSENKNTQVAVMVAWGLVGLLVGHFAWGIFG